MVRLDKTLASAVLLAACLAIVALQADAQSAPPAPSNQVTPVPGTAPTAPGQPLHWQVRQTPTQAPRSAPAASQAMTPMPQRTAAATPVRATSKTKRMLHGKQAAAEEPQAPAPPPTLEQSPPTAPKVSFRNGQLTIDASNSTLAQVLRAVQSQTGAAMEIPAGAGGDRVVAELGPGEPNDVLRTLLNGSRFDYVILGVVGNPGAVQRVILTPRQAGAAVATAQNNPPSAQAGESENPDDGFPVADNGDQDNQPSETPPMPPRNFRRPMMPIQPGVQPGEAQGYTGPGQGYTGPGGEAQSGKTPEELMQELQQMQLQQQQYEQQLNPANQTPQP